MTAAPAKYQTRPVADSGQHEPPAIVRFAGNKARFAYDEFFAGEENSHTERAYRHAVTRFLAHCETLGVALHQITPGILSDYLKKLQAEIKTRHGQPQRFRPASKPMKKLHLAGIRKFFDKLVERHAIMLNPALSVRGPKHSVTEGKTPALSVQQARQVLGSIDTRHALGRRDRAIIAVMIYTAVRAGAVAKLRRRDFYNDGRQSMLRFDEKGGKIRDIPVRHDLETFVEEYLESAGQSADDSPLFRSAAGRTGKLSDHGMTQNDVLRMVKRRFAEAGLPSNRLTCHSFRATTITDLLDQGVPLEDVQYLAGHSDPRTTRLYDRRKKQVTRNIVERISI
ncbi:MAG: tyrosine-type recombinase/integrase [Phycisphaerales bacterium]|nr:tyrosine-type recombinase/integrase [Phycisphaerales bacterium]